MNTNLIIKALLALIIGYSFVAAVIKNETSKGICNVLVALCGAAVVLLQL